MNRGPKEKILGVAGDLFGGHVRLVFTLVLFIYLFCVFVTLTSFSEMPLSALEQEAIKVSRLED